MSSAVGSLVRGFSTYVQQRVDGWRTGSRKSQTFLLLVLLGLAGIALGVGALADEAVPTSMWFLLLMLGLMLLRFVPLLLLATTLVGIAVWTAVDLGFTQSAGYLIAAGGPFTIGLVYAATGTWTVPLGLMIVLVLPMALLVNYIGPTRYVEDQLPERAVAS